MVRPRARLLALDPAAGVAPLAGAHAAADALAILARLRGLQVAQIQLVRHYDSSISTRCLTLRSMPWITGVSSCSAVRPILPRPSARRVPRWRCDWPMPLRVCRSFSFAIVGHLFRHRSLVGEHVSDREPARPVDLVTDHDERGERETPAALDHLGDAVDLDHALLELSALLNVDCH